MKEKLYTLLVSGKPWNAFLTKECWISMLVDQNKQHLINELVEVTPELEEIKEMDRIKSHVAQFGCEPSKVNSNVVTDILKNLDVLWARNQAEDLPDPEEKIEYSTTIVNDGISDGRYVNKCLDDVIAQIEYFSKCSDCVTDLEGSKITVYVDGTDLLVASKDTDGSLEDFMAELSRESEILGA